MKNRLNILDFLGTGKENALTAKELAELMHCKARDIAANVQYCRNFKGAPICSINGGDNPGYFIGNAKEMRECIWNLEHRVKEQKQTCQAMKKTLDKMAEEQEE